MNTANAQTEPATQAAESPDVVDSTMDLGQTMPTIIELLPESWQPYWQMIQQIPLLEALMIVLIFALIALIMRRYVLNMVVMLAGRTEGELDDQIVDELKGPIFATVVWVGVIAAVISLGIKSSWSYYIVLTIMSIIVLSWLRAAMALSTIVFTALSRDTKRFKKIDVRTEPLLIIISKIIILLVGSYILLILWGINPVGLLASAGVVGIAVGFAAKDTLANLFSGVFILADRPYKLGDYVNLDNGERGKVTHIGIRSTRILTRDDIEITIPNGVIGNATVVNESGGPHQKMRIRLNVQCSYDSDLDQVNEVLMQIIQSEDAICAYPSPRVRVRGFAGSGIDLQLMGWIDHPEDRGRIMHVLYMKIHTVFKETGIEIPYPRRDLVLRDPPEPYQAPEEDLIPQPHRQPEG